MQKWEYCAMIGMQRSSDSREFWPRWPAIWHFTDGGIKETEIKRDERNFVAKTIAQLGEEGWEMVGCGPMAAGAAGGGSRETTHAIYFKRVKP